MSEKQKQGLDRTCPICRAGVGQPCISDRGRVREYAHKRRINDPVYLERLKRHYPTVQIGSCELERVNHDARGDIYSLHYPDRQEVMLFFCKAGHLRGGHYHNVLEGAVLLSGQATYYKFDLKTQTEEIIERKAGDAWQNQPGEVHLAFFPEDSVILEWKIGTRDGAWETIDYEPYREKVRESIKA